MWQADFHDDAYVVSARRAQHGIRRREAPPRRSFVMAQWVYKASRANATYADAHHLTVLDHFLCSALSARSLAPQGAREIGMVADVAVGDEIHGYYRTNDGSVRCLGTFSVMDGSGFAGVFGPCAGHGAAVQVRETAENWQLLARLRRSYWHDPTLAVFTGWAVERLPIEFRTPGYNQARMFPSLNTWLWRYPDPDLLRTRAVAVQ
jgi:hypothetical protein